MKTLLIGLFILINVCVFSQKKDTLFINGEHLRISALIPGKHTWLVYTKNGQDSSRLNFQIWTRKIEFTEYNGINGIAITQLWEDSNGELHKVYSFCDLKSFSPLYHDSWWKTAGSTITDFNNRKIILGGNELTGKEEDERAKRILSAFQKTENVFVLNWHLDLEVFSVLPLRKNRTYAINFYDPGLAFEPQLVYYTVTGTAQFTGYNNQKIDCWILQHFTDTSKETFWISQKTNEVMKLEQEFNGRYRYKIKIGLSD